MTTLRANDCISDYFEAALACRDDVPFGAVGFRIDGSRITLFGALDSVEEKAAIYEIIDDFTMLRDIDDRLLLPIALPLAA